VVVHSNTEYEGEVLAFYRIAEEAWMGIVVKVRNTELDLIVAIKIPRTRSHLLKPRKSFHPIIIFSRSNSVFLTSI